MWDFKTMKEKFRFKLHKVKVQALAFSPNDKFLVSLGGQVRHAPFLPHARTTTPWWCGISKRAWLSVGPP